MTGEETLIEIIKALVQAGPQGSGLVHGIGDDCAVFEPAEGTHITASTDSFVEDVHFKRSWMTPEDIGYLAACGAVSDLAAMASVPKWMLLTIKVPADTQQDFTQKTVTGVLEVCKKTGMTLAGGNLSRADKISLDITVLGEVQKNKSLLRSGAREGDEIWLSGFAGTGLARRLLFESAAATKDIDREKLFPKPRLKEALFLSRHTLITAMADTSDGLARDLWHICQSSKTGARLDMENIPVCPELSKLNRSDPLKDALYGGEDYELIFCAAPESTKDLQQAFKEQFPATPLSKIGTITGLPAALTMLGKSGQTEISPSGFDHFSEN